MMLAQFGWALFPAILLGLIAGLVWASSTALIITMKLPFIATMGTTQIINSVALLLTNGKPVLGLGTSSVHRPGQGAATFPWRYGS